MNTWDVEHRTQRLWARDSSLWTNLGESQWMGWLNVVQDMRAQLPTLLAFADEIRTAGFKHIVVLGMGGSSLCARVFEKTFGAIDGFPELHVLDSTDPAQIRTCEERCDLEKTLFVVSSKSGTTLETRLLAQYFQSKAKHFIAITDPGSELDKPDAFIRVFHGVETIGGRFSALTNFGLLPAALMGVDIGKILESAKEMFHACGPSVSAENNPGVQLGLFLGNNALLGRDKLTLLISPEIRELGAFVEQLIAESTGKNGKGLVVVDREPLARVAEYGADRLFAHVRLDAGSNDELDVLVDLLKQAGHPVHTLHCANAFAIGAEFFLWEFATAVASSLLGVNPFDQPDVESTKVVTLKLTEGFEATGRLISDQYALFDVKTLVASLRPHDYFALCAFIEMNEEHEELLLEIREMVRGLKGVATCHGFGPSYLHSTGQLYKGGPRNGVFIVVTCDDNQDIPVPNRKITFGQVKESQARADLSVLTERGLRCAHYHIKGNVAEGLRSLKRELIQG